VAWTAEKTWADGEVPTGDQLNLYVRDNLTYLKGKTDRLGVAALDSNARTAATSYQNTSGKIMFVMVSAPNNALVGDGDPPAVDAGTVDGDSVTATQSLLFMVPVGWYYQIDIDGTCHELKI